MSNESENSAEVSSQPKASNPTQVLIVGAGPTGLTAAAILGKLGVRVRIVDKNTTRAKESRALGVQAGTLECLAKAFRPELSQAMVEAGTPAREAWMHIQDVKPVHVHLTLIPSKYNYVLILPQSETERFLEDEAIRHDVKVERQTEVIEVIEKDQKVHSTLKHASGETETVVSDFVIGCDGAHSIVRKASGIAFEGKPYSGDFILGDVSIQWPWDKTSIRTFIRKKGIVVCFPMKQGQYRLILIPKFKKVATEDGATENAASASPDISLNEFRKILAEITANQIEVTGSTWLTRFRVHHRLAHHFQKGRMFLAGDAGHIHSPAGGQGMNTGIQDALNLGFKLAKVLKHEADIESLENYEKERLPVARAVVHSTDLVFKMALLPENPVVAFVRKYILPRVIGTSFIQRWVVRGTSEIEAARKELKKFIDPNI